MLGAVVDDFGHVAGNRGKAVLSGLQQEYRVFNGPQIAQTEGVPAFDIGAGEKIDTVAAGIAHGLFLEGNAARRMAGAAVTQPLDQISAAIPWRILAAIGHERLAVDEEPVPQGQSPTQGERPVHLGGLVRLLDRRQTAHQIGVQGTHIVVIHLGVRGIRHGRIEIVAVLGHPMAHRPLELCKGISADAGTDIGRDVGRIELAERRFQTATAGHRLAFFRAVTGNAVTEMGDIFPALDQCRIGADISQVLHGSRAVDDSAQTDTQHRDLHKPRDRPQ